jgi:hypothetical protein
MPAAIQRFFIEPSFHVVTRRLVHLAIEIIDWMQLVLVSVLANVPRIPRRATVNTSSSPSRNDAAASGCSASSSLASRPSSTAVAVGAAGPDFLADLSDQLVAELLLTSTAIDTECDRRRDVVARRHACHAGTPGDAPSSIRTAARCPSPHGCLEVGALLQMVLEVPGRTRGEERSPRCQRPDGVRADETKSELEPVI